MGNVASCTPSIGVLKVISSDGTLRIYTKPVKAAELMLEKAGEFVCDASHLNVGQRIPALAAEEELEPRHSYFLLPMDMLYSVLTNEDMSYLNDKASKALKHGNLTLSKFFPVFVDFHCLFPEGNKKLCFATNEEDQEDLCLSSRVRSWKPALETIIEVPTPPNA